MAIKIRRAKITDIPQLVEKFHVFYDLLKEKGARDVAQDDQVLRGGIIIEVGSGFNNPHWNCLVGIKNEEEIVAFMVGILEFCGPTSQHMRCVRIHADYLKENSLAGPKVLTTIWNLMEQWGQENGAGYFYANIHPGNQASVKAAKSVGFKHHYTQFYRPISLDTKVEEE
jgi:hypothetical protein